MKICGLKWVTSKTTPTSPLPISGKIRIVDLFCGCGGLTLGAAEAARHHQRQLEIKLAIDNFAPAIDVYRGNFSVNSDIARLIDIREILSGDPGQAFDEREKTIKSALGSVDIIVAGPPCQGHSDLNNSSRRNDERNKLNLKVVRLAELVKPKAILIENVPSVIHDRDNDLEKSKFHLTQLDYQPNDKIINLSILGLHKLESVT